jgi:urease accessory protein
MREAYSLAAEQNTEGLEELEELSCAVKVTKESRESSLRMGKAFMRIMTDVLDDAILTELKKQSGMAGITYPVIYGAVCGRLGIDIEEAMKAFVFSTVNGLVQCAVKLVPLGNTQAQQIMQQLYPAMEMAVSRSMDVPVDEISNFCPGLDIAGINHEFLTTRLYMS